MAKANEVILQKYRITSEDNIGRGGFGIVSVGIVIETNERVAIKTISLDDIVKEMPHSMTLYM